MAGRRVARRSPGRGPRPGEARARETLAVRPGTVPRSLIPGEPGTGAGRGGTRRPRVLLERVLAIRLSWRRAARERALRR